MTVEGTATWPATGAEVVSGLTGEDAGALAVTVLLTVTAEVMTEGVVRTVVLPEVVKVWPTGQVVTVDFTTSVT